MNISSTKLIQLRNDRGWSQERLAAISGVSERTIQRAEKDGSCSLDTTMALATAFDITPGELTTLNELDLDHSQIEYTTDWIGAFCLFILGLCTLLTALVTKTNSTWDVVSFAIVWGLTVITSMISFGGKETYKLFNNGSWIVKYPNYVPNLNTYICQAHRVINNAYIVGFSSTLVASFTIASHTDLLRNDISSFFIYSIKPLIYTLLFVELYFRPYKLKMERMLQHQQTQI